MKITGNKYKGCHRIKVQKAMGSALKVKENDPGLNHDQGYVDPLQSQNDSIHITPPRICILCSCKHPKVDF